MFSCTTLHFTGGKHAAVVGYLTPFPPRMSQHNRLNIAIVSAVEDNIGMRGLGHPLRHDSAAADCCSWQNWCKLAEIMTRTDYTAIRVYTRLPAHYPRCRLAVNIRCKLITDYRLALLTTDGETFYSRGTGMLFVSRFCSPTRWLHACVRSKFVDFSRGCWWGKTHDISLGPNCHLRTR